MLVDLLPRRYPAFVEPLAQRGPRALVGVGFKFASAALRDRLKRRDARRPFPKQRAQPRDDVDSNKNAAVVGVWALLRAGRHFFQTGEVGALSAKLTQHLRHHGAADTRLVPWHRVDDVDGA